MFTQNLPSWSMKYFYDFSFSSFNCLSYLCSNVFSYAFYAYESMNQNEIEKCILITNTVKKYHIPTLSWFSLHFITFDSPTFFLGYYVFIYSSKYPWKSVWKQRNDSFDIVAVVVVIAIGLLVLNEIGIGKK